MFFVHVFHVHVGSGLLMIMVVHVQLFHVHGGSCSYFSCPCWFVSMYSISWWFMFKFSRFIIMAVQVHVFFIIMVVQVKF